GIPASPDRTLAQRAHAPRPTAPIDVDANEDDRRPVPAIPTYPAPVARKAVPRHHPRWEPGALAAPAGICAGGGEKSPSLPRPLTSLASAPAAERTLTGLSVLLQSGALKRAL